MVPALIHWNGDRGQEDAGLSQLMNTMLSGGSQARQVDQKSDEKPCGYSQLEVHREVSAPSPRLQPGKTAVSEDGWQEGEASRSWVGARDWLPHRTGQLPRTCTP